MEYQHIILERSGNAAIIWLNNPDKRNPCLLYTSPSPRDW